MRGLEKNYPQDIQFVWVNILQPESQSMIDEYGFSSTPEIYLVDPQGVIVGFWDDSLEIVSLQNALDQVVSVVR